MKTKDDCPFLDRPLTDMELAVLGDVPRMSKKKFLAIWVGHLIDEIWRLHGVVSDADKRIAALEEDTAPDRAALAEAVWLIENVQQDIFAGGYAGRTWIDRRTLFLDAWKDAASEGGSE